MILGDLCTRGCRFCAVKSGKPNGELDEQEPENTAQTIRDMGLTYIVITSVDRDDLPDQGLVFGISIQQRRHLAEIRKDPFQIGEICVAQRLAFIDLFLKRHRPRRPLVVESIQKYRDDARV